MRLSHPEAVDRGVYAAVSTVFPAPSTESAVDVDAKLFRFPVLETLEFSMWASLLARAIRAPIRRRRPTHSGYGDLPWRHDHWAVIFEDVPSGLLHPFHGLKDGWKDSLVVSTREQFVSASGGKSLSEVCVEAVKKYGAPYYVTTGELVSYLRTDIGGKSNWSVGVKDWPEREVLGQDCGGKTTFVKWHGTTS